MITQVAVRYKDFIYCLPKPNRHFHVLRLIMKKTGDKLILQDEQGFLTDSGVFLRRAPALIYAREHGQILDETKVRTGKLYSEDLW